MAATATARSCPWQQTGAAHDMMCQQPEPSLLQPSQIRKSYPWRNISGQLYGSWSGGGGPLLATGDLADRLQAELAVNGDSEQESSDHKVHGGMPRTISLPAMSSNSSSPEGRLSTALGAAASAPAVPPHSLASQISGPGGLQTAAHDCGSSRPASAPPVALMRASMPAGRFACATEPYPPASVTEWPDPLDTSGMSSSAPMRAEALHIPRLRGRGVRTAPTLGGACSHGSSCALDVLNASGSATSSTAAPGSQAEPASFGKQHGSSSALHLLASQGSSVGGEAAMSSSLGAGGMSSSFGSRVRHGLSADMSGWAERLHLRRSGGGGLAAGGDGGSDEEDPLVRGKASQLPAGQLDEQLASPGRLAWQNFGLPQRAPSPVLFPSAAFGRPALTVATGRHGPVPSPTQGAASSAFAAPRSPLALGQSNPATPHGLSREESSELQLLEKHQRGSSAALDLLVGAFSDDNSPDSSQRAPPTPPHGRAGSVSGSNASCSRSPAPPRRAGDNEQPRTLRSPKRGGSGRLVRTGSAGPVLLVPEQIRLPMSSGDNSPLAAGMLGVSSSDSLGGGGGKDSSSSSTAGSADWTSRFGSLSAEYSTQPLDPISESERTMKAGMRRGSISPKAHAPSMAGALSNGSSTHESPQHQPSPAAAAAAVAAVATAQDAPSSGASDSSVQAAGSPPQNIEAQPAAAGKLGLEDPHSGFGSLIAGEGAGSQGWWAASLKDAAAAGVTGLPSSPPVLERNSAGVRSVDKQTVAAMDAHRSTFGSVAWPEDAAAVAAAAHARVNAHATADAMAAGFPEDRGAAAHTSGHSHSAPTAVKVVPRIGAEGDDSGLWPRFTSLPTHLDSITER